LLSFLSQLILSEPSGTEGHVVDVGSGTGIFTRQLRALLPAVTPIVGIEPAPDMRLTAEAMSSGIPGSSYVDGLAQRLPIPSGQARAVVAATATHWFAAPCSMKKHAGFCPPGASSPSSSMCVTSRDHPRPPPAELRAAPGFHNLKHRSERVISQLSAEAFVALVLSSSHARHAIETLGEQAAANLLLDMAEPLLARHGHIPFGYVFHLFTVRRC
jgi:SAM-dependent methyltransferase